MSKWQLINPWYFFIRVCVHNYRQYTGGVYCCYCGARYPAAKAQPLQED